MNECILEGGENFQQELQRQNFLSDVLPCDVQDTCEEPGGTLLAAGALESSLNSSKPKSKKSIQRCAELKQEIQIAVGEAFDACGEGEAEDCSAAWDKVEDLSYELDKEEDKL